MIYTILMGALVAPAIVFGFRHAQHQAHRRARRSRINQMWRETDAARMNRISRF